MGMAHSYKWHTCTNGTLVQMAHLYKYWSLVSFLSTVGQHNYQCHENTAVTSLCTGTAPSAGPWCRLADFRRCCATSWLHGSWYADWNCGAELTSQRGHVSGFLCVLHIWLKGRLVRKAMKCRRGAPTGGSQKLHAKEQHDLCSLWNIIWVIRRRMMMQARHNAVMVKNKNVYRVLVGKPEGMIPLGRLA